MAQLPNHISVQLTSADSTAPTPPTFTPNDRFVTPGDCPSKGHVYVFSSAQQNWRCVSCQHVAPAGRPAPSVPAPAYPAPEPFSIPLGPLNPQPEAPTWQPGGPIRPMPGLPMATSTFGFAPSRPCLWDNIPPEDRGKPMMLSCPCPRCSAWC